MFQIDPGRQPGNFIPVENQVPNQEIDGPRAMSPPAPVREQEHHDDREPAGLGQKQHDEMELENMLPLQQMVNLDQNDHMLEDGDGRLREQVMSPRERGHRQVNAAQDRQFAFANEPAKWSQKTEDRNTLNAKKEET